MSDGFETTPPFISFSCIAISSNQAAARQFLSSSVDPPPTLLFPLRTDTAVSSARANRPPQVFLGTLALLE
jgi:hypothetical protein